MADHANAESIGFLGAGQMATALAKGWINAGLLAPAVSMASDTYITARDAFQASTTIRTTANNVEVVQRTKILILAVKPQVLPAVLRDLESSLTPEHLLISIAAGVTIEQLCTGHDARVVRVMPNTPCLVGSSASAYSLARNATPEDAIIVGRLFGAVGIAFSVQEPLLDAVTGLSGSGPAYAYIMIEALADGGVRAGLPRDIAMKLAAQTLLGAARMVLETGQHPGQLKDAVASPGGTTIAGLHALERGGVRAALIDAVVAATHRATELGKPTS